MVLCTWRKWHKEIYGTREVFSVEEEGFHVNSVFMTVAQRSAQISSHHLNFYD